MTPKALRKKIKCEKCHKNFIQKYPSRVEKYCSRLCWSVRGNRHEKACVGCGKLGLTRSENSFCSRECAHKQTGDLAQAFKGKKAGYSAVHKWITANFGRPEKCLYCEEKGKRMHWANIDHKYNRRREDWIPLCAKCHCWFDKGDPHYCSVIIERWQKFTGKEAVKLEPING